MGCCGELELQTSVSSSTNRRMIVVDPQGQYVCHASADRQVNHPSFYSLSSGHLGKCQLQVQKSSKEKPSCQTSQVHLASSPLALLPTFWALRLLGGFGGENRGACCVPAGSWLPVLESTSPTTLYHTSPHHSTLARPGFCNQSCV